MFTNAVRAQPVNTCQRPLHSLYCHSVDPAMKVADVFAIPDATEFIKSFDFSKLVVKDSSRDDHLTIGLAPSFRGKMLPEEFKKMDDNIKVMILGTTKAISKIAPEDRTWKSVVAALQTNSLIEPDGEEIARSDKLIKENDNFFKFSGAPDPSTVREVETWFHGLINDSDISSATPINIEELANIVAQTGATVTGLESAIYKKEEHSKTVCDIGILRYPDIVHPFFKVYRLQLTAWSSCERIAGFQHDKNGITGDFASRRYKPRDSVINGLKKEVRDIAIQGAEDLIMG
ncbi:hypothetical protein BDN72DRAFT_145466 [Pluteus cervinus]|uniref:Uncharacterized protein n=1 Tax=Pluteus cervinus TaxID=181527 RepID=A0ACD3ALR5_9AGAR|nr:hypothetical protein BDN72DRAFT_145466 [Pluteus cervinus]